MQQFSDFVANTSDILWNTILLFLLCGTGIWFTFTMKFVQITILGGVGTFWGPFLGALVLIPLQEYTRAYLSNLGAGVDLIIFGLIIIIVMIKQPLGIMGIIRSFIKDKKSAEEVE